MELVSKDHDTDQISKILNKKNDLDLMLRKRKDIYLFFPSSFFSFNDVIAFSSRKTLSHKHL